MVNLCCVVGCKILYPKEVTYFRFPVSRCLRKKWLEAIKPANKPSATAVVCSRHFLKTDYEFVRGKMRLKADIIPSVFTIETNNTIRNCKDIPNCTEEDMPKLYSNKKIIKNTVLNKGLQDKTEDKDPNEKTDQDSDSDKVEKQKELREDTEKCSTDNDKQAEVIKKKDLGEKSDNENEDKNNKESEDSVSKKAKREDRIDDLKNIDTAKRRKSEIRQGIESAPLLPAGPPDIDKVEDIEDLLTNYHIKQNNIHKSTEVVLEASEHMPSVEALSGGEQNVYQNTQDYPVFPEIEKKDPVFIEVAVDQDPTSSEKADCLMLLESVQVELDPDALMLLQEDQGDVEEPPIDLDDEPIHIGDDDPISLLTSTDEDEVIIQEPLIDTVEVSDETDEDDVPLMKLIKSDPVNNILWNMYNYYCVECHFRTTDKAEYKKHTQTHQKVILMCQLCGYMTSSEAQLMRHEKSHKDDKKYQCHLCDYKAKHNISLIYHLKTHKKRKGFKCSDCSFKVDSESEALKHVVSCSAKRRSAKSKYSCDKCEYSTKKPSDLKRHQARKHRQQESTDDESLGSKS